MLYDLFTLNETKLKCKSNDDDEPWTHLWSLNTLKPDIWDRDKIKRWKWNEQFIEPLDKKKKKMFFCCVLWLVHQDFMAQLVWNGGVKPQTEQW